MKSAVTRKGNPEEEIEERRAKRKSRNNHTICERTRRTHPSSSTIRNNPSKVNF
jgi:hypothetical protein